MIVHNCATFKTDKAKKSPHLLQWRWAVLCFLRFFDEIRRIDSRTIRIGTACQSLRGGETPLICFNDTEQFSAFCNLPMGSYGSTDFYWRCHSRRSERALPTVPACLSKVTVWWSAQDANQNAQNCCDGLAVPGGNSQVHRVPLHPHQGRCLWILRERW